MTQIVGRAAERAILGEQLRALLNGQAGTIVIEGDAGIGKSRLTADLLEQARALGIATLVGAGDAIEQEAAYHAWRPVFRQLFDLGDVTDVATVRERVVAELPNDSYMLARAPLLNVVVPLNLPENELTSQMS